MAINKKTPASKSPAKPRQTRQRKVAPPTVFDVARPSKGQLRPNATSRSIITNHATVTDDSVVTTKVTVEDSPPAPQLTPTKKLVIQPLHSAEEVKNEPVVAPPAPQPLGAPKLPIELEADTAPSVESHPEPTPEPTVEPAAALTPEPVPEVSAVAESPTKPPQVVDMQVVQDEAPIDPILPAGVPTEKEDKPLRPDQAEAALQAAQERAARLQQIVEKEQYFLPINAVQERRSRRIAIAGLLLIIILAIAWYDIALDAGIMPNLYNLPHTHLFVVR